MEIYGVKLPGQENDATATSVLKELEEAEKSLRADIRNRAGNDRHIVV